MSRHLMAKMRRTAGWADWTKVTGDHDLSEMMMFNPDDHPETEYHVAPLESGHELHAYNHVDYDENDDPVVDPSKGFSWQVWDPYEPDVVDAGGLSSQHPLPEETKGRARHIPTLEQAMDEAEKSYVDLVRGGLRGLQGHPNHPGMGF